MALALVGEASSLVSSVSAYLDLDKKVDGAEEDAIFARWEFGQLLLIEREANGGRQLPHGRLDQLSSATGKSHRELQFRVRFAEQFPQRDKVRNAFRTYGSWFAIVKDALPAEPKTERVPEPPPAITEDDLWRAIENRLLEIETVISEFKTRRYAAATPLFAGLANFARVVRDAKH